MTREDALRFVTITIRPRDFERAVGHDFQITLASDGTLTRLHMEGEHHFTRSDYYAERERLLNAPDWKKASPIDQFRAMDSDGQWFFYNSQPALRDEGGKWLRLGYYSSSSAAYAVPAGYDWRESLEKRPH